MKPVFALLSATLILASFSWGGEFPAFESDFATDQWLREHSGYYRMMSDAVQAKTKYTFARSAQIPGGDVKMEDGKLVIELSDTLTGAKRVSILIFELTNCYQQPQHREIDEAAASGRLTTAREFGILHELVEMDGLRHHRFVLEDLDRELKGIPPVMLQWINPKLQKLSDYNVPFAYDHIKAMEKGGHTQHYYDWFPKQAKVPPPQPR